MTDNQQATPRTEFVASWRDWEGAICVELSSYQELQRTLTERTEELAEAKRISSQRSDGWDYALDIATKYLHRAETAEAEVARLKDLSRFRPAVLFALHHSEHGPLSNADYQALLNEIDQTGRKG